MHATELSAPMKRTLTWTAAAIGLAAGLCLALLVAPPPIAGAQGEGEGYYGHPLQDLDECTPEDLVPDVSHDILGSPHPEDADTYVVNYVPVLLTISASVDFCAVIDAGLENICAGVDVIEYRINGGDWVAESGSSFELPAFDEGGTHLVEYRATDRFGNSSAIHETSFTTVVVDDTDAPTVTASLSGQEIAEGRYFGRVELKIEAADELSPIDSIEYSTDGGDSWTTETYNDPDYDGGWSESLKVEFTDDGDYEVLYRATDVAENTSEPGAEEFTIASPDVCVGPRSDEFDGDSLDPKWEVVRWDPARDDASVAGGNLVFPLGANSFDQARTGPMTMLGQELPEEDFTIEAKINAPGLNTDTGNMDSNYAQVGFKLFQTEDDWIKIAHTRNADGGASTNTYFEVAYENGGNRVLGTRAGNAPAATNLPTFWFRVTRSGDQVSTEYSIDDPDQGGSWLPLMIDGGTTVDLSIFNPADGPIYIGPYGGNGSIDATYEYIRFMPDEGECPEACGRSDEFDSGVLDTDRWTNIRVEEPGEYSISDGQLVLPILNEIDGTATGPLALVSQQVPEGDWSLTTRVTPDLNSSWAQAGIMLWQSDGNFVKFVFGRNSGGTQHRVEIASDDPVDQRETSGGATSVDMSIETMWLRLNRVGNSLIGEYAPDEAGEPGTWVQHPKTTLVISGVQPANGRTIDPPREGDGVQLGLYAGADIDGPPFNQLARFGFARFDPDEDCPGEPENRPPSIDAISATPDAGQAPLEVSFSAEASDPDDDELTYEWDFGDGNGSTEQNPTHTYTDPGVYEAVLTASDGELEAVDSVTVSVDPPADTTPPVTTHTLIPPDPGGGGTYEGPVTVELLATDPGEYASGVAETLYRATVDGGAGDWQAYSVLLPPTFSADGDYLIEYYSVDNTGNEEDVREVSFSIDTSTNPGTPELGLTAQPRLHRVASKRKQVRFRFRAANVGDAPSGTVNLCAKGPRKRVRILGKRCVARQIPAGETRQRPVRVRIKPAARGTQTRLKLVARGSAVGNQRIQVRIRARR